MLSLFLAYLDDPEDKSLFEKIYYSYRKQMFTVAFSVVHNDADAEDVVSNVFLKISSKYWDIVRAIKNDVDLRNYLLKATKNTALNTLARKRKEKLSLDENGVTDLLSDEDLSDETFEEKICKSAEYDQIVEAIRSLDNIYRDTLYYHFVLEFTIPMTAKILNQSVAATKKQVYRGKAKLLEILKSEGIE